MLRLVVVVMLAVMAQLSPLSPVRSTAQVPNDPDDPAIWINAADPEKGLVFATDKMPATGGLYVFRLDGTLKKAITPLDRPNNVDVEYGFSVGGRPIDIEIDGGVTSENTERVTRAGANALVAGSAVFKGGPGAYRANIDAIRSAAALARGEAA